MNIFELIKSDIPINNGIIQQFVKTSNNLPEMVKKLLSAEANFYDTTMMYRLLGTEEILESKKNLGVDFLSKSILPLFDLQSNDFICYDIQKNGYFILNIVDEIDLIDVTDFFEYHISLEELVKKWEGEYED